MQGARWRPCWRAAGDDVSLPCGRCAARQQRGGQWRHALWVAGRGLRRLGRDSTVCAGEPQHTAAAGCRARLLPVRRRALWCVGCGPEQQRRRCGWRGGCAALRRAVLQLPGRLARAMARCRGVLALGQHVAVPQPFGLRRQRSRVNSAHAQQQACIAASVCAVGARIACHCRGGRDAAARCVFAVHSRRSQPRCRAAAAAATRAAPQHGTRCATD